MPHDRHPSTSPDLMPRVFSDVGVLLSQPARWAAWLVEHPEHADLFDSIYREVVLLAEETAWPRDVVLDELGCNTKTEEELLALDAIRLSSCCSYMRWVRSLMAEVDTRSDKRLTANGAARFFVASGLDVDVCGIALSTGEFSGIDYLRIGEIAQAFQVARCELDGTSGDDARHLRDQNPFLDEHSPHLVPQRLETLNGPDAIGRLGPNVARRMIEHIDDCEACRLAFERRSSASWKQQQVAAAVAV